MTRHDSTAHGTFRAAAWGMALTVLGQQALRVEDGQFTREYSRIFTALVLGVALVLLLAVGAGIAGLLRSRE